MSLLSNSEQKQLVELLNKLEPGFFPFEIFHALTRLVVTPTYLTVPLFYEDELYVHLTPRGEDDLHWAGLLNVPGKVILSTDKTINDIYLRLYNDEMKGFDILDDPIFCGYVFDEIPRGKEVSIINYVSLKTKPKHGELHKVNSLPKNVIPTEIKRIEMAVKKYMENNKTELS